jgi:hypothetical protein
VSPQTGEIDSGLTNPEPIGSLDWETFETEYSAIAIQVKAILSAKGKTRRRFRIVAVYEAATSEPVGEILRTTFGPVLVTRGADVDMTRKVDNGTATVVGFRLARGEHRLAIWPFTGAAHEMYELRSHSKRYPISCESFVARNYHGLVFK